MHALRTTSAGVTDPFTKTEADNSALSDARVSTDSGRPSYTGSLGITDKLVATLAVESNTTLATLSFDVHLLWNHKAAEGTSNKQWKGTLVKIGTIAATAGASQISSADDAFPSGYPCTLVWTATSDYTAMAAALGEDAGTVVDNLLVLACLGRADQLIVKPSTFSGAGVTGMVFGRAAVV